MKVWITTILTKSYHKCKESIGHILGRRLKFRTFFRQCSSGYNFYLAMAAPSPILLHSKLSEMVTYFKNLNLDFASLITECLTNFKPFSPIWEGSTEARQF
jgi:hypothetical protein